MLHVHLSRKWFAANAAKEGRSRVESCYNQMRRLAKRSSDDTGSNRGSTTVANAAKGTSSSYVEDMYQLWLKDKAAVHSSWDNYFTSLEASSKSSLGTTTDVPASRHGRKARLDKDQLVRFVKSTAKVTSPAQETRKKQTLERTIGETEGPIVIKIDIINEPDDDAKSVKSVKSVHSVQSGQSRSSSRKMVEEVRSPKVPGVRSSVPTSPKPSAANQAQKSLGKPSTSVPKTGSKMKISPLVKPAKGIFPIAAKASSVQKPNRQTTPTKPVKQTGPAPQQTDTASSTRSAKQQAKPPVQATPQNIPVSRDLRSQPQTSPKSSQVQQIAPKAIPPNEINDWRSHVVQFLRTYHLPTGGLAPKLPKFGSKLAPLPQPASLRSRSSASIRTDGSRSVRSAPRSRSIDSKQTTGSRQATAPLSKPPPSPPITVKPGTSVRKSSSGGVTDNIAQHLAVQGVIRSYQTRGHFMADLDPLGILGKDLTTLEQRNGLPPAYIIRQHTALEGIDLSTKFRLPTTTYIGEGQTELPLREIIARLEKAYCHHIGAEFMYIQDMKRSLWIREYMETPNKLEVDDKTKKQIMQRLIQAVQLEEFLGKKYPNDKRFGLEGAESTIACIKQIIDTGTDLGLDGVNISMAHRGRVNVLANVCRKSMKDIFTAFRGLEPEETGSGDVKYHLGTVVTRENSTNKKKVRISVLANPSHLETVMPVGLGKTRCEQFLKGDKDGKTVMALCVHGDSAFCGQGVVYESIHLTHLPCYTTRGSIHVVINNQVGFTTDPRFYKSSPYCTDVGRVVTAPIFHVNGDDPEAVVAVAKLAMLWRQTFHDDVVIDIVSYRRRGHNEQDEPMFTQPLMYQIIAKRPHIAQIYAEKLIKEGVVTQADIDSYSKAYLDNLEKDHASAADEKKMRLKDWLDSPWKGFFKKYKFDRFPDTGVSEDTLVQIGTKFSTPPPGDFQIHRGIQRILKNRAKMVKERTTDWALGEAFAYASLMKDGYHVRLSGEDVERGTFSHRHHILHHQTKDMKIYNMLENVFPNQAPYTVCNSSLSEYGVMGFELGYSLVSPYMLVMWEAQFGDFVDTGQAMVDTYIANGQSKWFRQCGLVVQLPHGLEGMGPEHSSGRVERFLQMCDDDVVKHANFDEKFVLHQHEACNWFVANCTTPANLFHVLRRQLLLPFRKPLILMTPKSFLRHPKARSSFDDFLPGQTFQRVIPDAGPASKAPDQVKKLIFCSGRTYYDIMPWIEKANAQATIAVARAEQIAPFPYDLVAAEMRKYPNAKVFWAQEEHMNQGNWTYVHNRINAASGNKVMCEYNGRASSSAAATGSKKTYEHEVENYKKQILG